MASSGNPYLGSKVSLISKSDIRYEGTLYAIDAKESTLALARVRSYGTENRPTERPIPPRNETYEFIIFNGPDIKDIFLGKPSRQMPTLASGLPKDPAILQHSVKGIPVTEPAQPKGAPRQTRGGRRGRGQRQPNARQPAQSAQAARGQSGMKEVMAMFRGGSQPSNAQPLQKPQGKAADNGEPGFHVGTSGRGGRGQRRGGGGQTRGRGGRRSRSNNPTSLSEPGRPAKPKTTVKFETEYDFEQAIVEFKDMIDKFEKTALDDKDEQVAEAGPQPGEDGQTPDAVKGPQEPFYDKTKSFFDNISCEAKEKLKGPKPRNQYWKVERKLNMETFGTAGKRYRGRGGFRKARDDGKKVGSDAENVVGDAKPDRSSGEKAPTEGQQKQSQRRGSRRGSRQKPEEKTVAAVAV
jgi:protein LSM14